jgi:hypothetical protein
MSTRRCDGLEHQVPAYGAVEFVFDIFVIIVYGSVVIRPGLPIRLNHKIIKYRIFNR